MPKYTLHFIDHPRYGKVYPFVSYDHSKNYFALPLTFGLIHSFINTVCLYGSFIAPIFTPVAASFLCNPMYLVPSLWINYAVMSKYYVYFYGARAHCQNMFLKPDGKTVILETRDGDSREVRHDKFYPPKVFTSKYENRLDMSYGAN